MSREDLIIPPLNDWFKDRKTRSFGIPNFDPTLPISFQHAKARMECIRFLIDRFRPDVWWFGLLTEWTGTPQFCFFHWNILKAPCLRGWNTKEQEIMMKDIRVASSIYIYIYIYIYMYLYKANQLVRLNVMKCPFDRSDPPEGSC